jgi:hypothetical protein
MTLEEFAKKAGVSVFKCDPDWGGSIGYKCLDYPNSRVCGFRSEAAAYKSWLEDSFGTNTAKAVMTLLKQTKSV